MMISINPFAILAETVSPIYMQLFVVLMILLIIVGTLIDIMPVSYTHLTLPTNREV